MVKKKEKSQGITMVVIILMWHMNMWPSIQQLLRYFSLDQNGGQTNVA